MLLLLNKPFNVLCQFTDKSERQTLAHFVPVKNVYPAGRLDRDSEGLVVLTADGKLQHRISNPAFKLKKTYWAQVEGEPTEAALDSLRQGIMLKDGKTRPATVTRIPPPQTWPRNPPVRYRASIPTSWITITLSEGRNRQIRRMTAAIGHPVLRLIRISIGDWTLGDLQPGRYREIQPARECEWQTPTE